MRRTVKGKRTLSPCVLSNGAGSWAGRSCEEQQGREGRAAERTLVFRAGATEHRRGDRRRNVGTVPFGQCLSLACPTCIRTLNRPVTTAGCTLGFFKRW